MYRFTIILVVALLMSCLVEKQRPHPEFIDKLIADIKSKPKTNPGKSIWEYQYNGQKVYFIPMVCCDIPSYLYDEKGNLICMPDGGFTGRGDGKCNDFIKERTKGKPIWKDPRP